MRPLIPLHTRTIPPKERSTFSGISALVSKNDFGYVYNVVNSLYENSFDVYLGGTIVSDAIKGRLDSYTSIDLFALAPNESIKSNYIRGLNNRIKAKGSEQWKHFGMTIQRVVNGQVMDFKKGSKFYVVPTNQSEENLEFRLDSAIYPSDAQVPTPINLSFLSSLDGFKIIL